MNYNKDLFKKFFTEFYQHFEEYDVYPSHITSMHERLAEEYCQSALLYSYNTINETEKNPIKSIISTGLLVNFMWKDISGDETDKYLQISQITDEYEINTEEILLKIYLKDNPEKIEEYYKLIDEMIDFTDYLTHQKGIVLGEDGILKETLTVYYSIFLFCCVMDVWMDI